MPDGAAPTIDLAPAALEPFEPDATLDLVVAFDDLLPLTRLVGLARAAPSRPVSLVWHDNADAALAQRGLIMQRESRTWRMHLLEPAEWPVSQPAPILAEADTPTALDPAPPFDAVPVAAFEGRRRSYRAGAITLDVLHGTLRGIVDQRPVCRVLLSGPQSGVADTVPRLAALRVAIPRASLAAEAIAVAKGVAVPARHLGTPTIDADRTVSDGLATIIAYLLDVILFWADRLRPTMAAPPAEPVEAVHQARVATRRLRSALSLYKREVTCPELEALGQALKLCASRLGAVRDWDVFLEETGARLAEIADDRVTPLLRAATRRRNAAYAELSAYLAGAEFRQLELALGAAAALRPWERAHDALPLQRQTAPFASAVLERRLKHVRHGGRNFEQLSPPLLHELRKHCKRLRYAVEFFIPAFPPKTVKTFNRRLTALQAQLGAVNDMAVAADLMSQLGRVGRGYAAGVVEGWATATAVPARENAAKTWKKFRATDPFWKT